MLFSMSRILVSGLINVETTLKVDGFPLDYFPVRYAFNGVGASMAPVKERRAPFGSCAPTSSRVASRWESEPHYDA